MMRVNAITLGLILFVIGGIKIWLPLTTGHSISVEGCAGTLFEMDLGSSSAHCWGCYVTVAGLALITVPLLSMRCVPGFATQPLHAH